MQNQANMNEGTFRPGINAPMNIQPNSQQNFNAVQDISMTPMMPATGKKMNSMVYPEIFYKLQPHILMMCDQMDNFGAAMPTQDMVEQMTDNIYDDVCRMYPDIAEYARSNERMDTPEAVETARFGFGFPGAFNFRFRRRGLLRDLIDILLISEFARRRRRF